MEGGKNVNVSEENPLWISWHDSNWLPALNETNVMDYFSEKTNPFYDSTCNNEHLKIQGQSLKQLNTMTGIEYVLLHVQEPILYVIRKQRRHSPSDVTPIADFYIIAGKVYQAPDLASIINSRLLSTSHHLQKAFEEAISYYRYHTNTGYTWDFSSNKALTQKNEDKVKEEPSSLFQRQRVDQLLDDLLEEFPLPMLPQQAQQNIDQTNQSNDAKVETNESTEISVETIKKEIQENRQSNGGTEIKTEPLTSEIMNEPLTSEIMNEPLTSEIMNEPLTSEVKPPPE